MSDVLTGGCLCGGVRYAVTAFPVARRYCHCSLCRRWSGAAAQSNCTVFGSEFRPTAGEDLLCAYRLEDRKDWVFCTRCGSSLFTMKRWPPAPASKVNIRLGSIDDAPARLRPQCRIYVDSKASWVEITDDLPQFRESSAGSPLSAPPEARAHT